MPLSTLGSPSGPHADYNTSVFPQIPLSKSLVCGPYMSSSSSGQEWLRMGGWMPTVRRSMGRRSLLAVEQERSVTGKAPQRCASRPQGRPSAPPDHRRGEGGGTTDGTSRSWATPLGHPGRLSALWSASPGHLGRPSASGTRASRSPGRSSASGTRASRSPGRSSATRSHRRGPPRRGAEPAGR
jgi:hypothetical protein